MLYAVTSSHPPATPQDIDVIATGDDDAEVVEFTTDGSDNDQEEPKKPPKPKKHTTPGHAHCDINFVKHTSYPLLKDDTQAKWGEAQLTDPQPKVPPSRADQDIAGDYVLISGEDLVLGKNKGRTILTTFDPEDELILTSKWHQFDEEMTGQDLVDLGEECFLLWWQNVQAPKPKSTRKKKATAKSKKSKS
jgi:hypothetical protein